MKKKLFFVFSIIILLVFAVIFIAGFVYYRAETFTVDFLETGYRLDEKGEYLDDIPYDDYFKGIETLEGTDIRDFGAASDKSAAENTTSIQNAINALDEDGTLIVSGGYYSIGTIELKSNMTLFIEKGSALISCTTNEKHLLNDALIKAVEGENIKITGEGTIDGNADSFFEDAKTDELLMPLKNFNLRNLVLEQRKRIRFPKKNSGRVHLVLFKGCENIGISNIELKNSAEFTLYVLNSKGAHIENVIINNKIHTANADGIDIDGTSDVVIKNCFVVAADDAICLKAEYEKVDNVLVEDCKVMSLANSFKIGTATNKDVTNVTVKNCYFFVAGTIGGYAGISIQSADGATVENISIENIEMQNVNSAFLIWLGSRSAKTNGVGSVNNITLTNIYANNINFPSAITGCKYKGKEYKPSSIEIKDCNFIYRDSGERLMGKNINITAGESGYPEITRVSHFYIGNHSLSIYFDLPVYGFYARYCGNVKIENFNVTPRTNTKLKMSNINL